MAYLNIDTLKAIQYSQFSRFIHKFDLIIYSKPLSELVTVLKT